MTQQNVQLFMMAHQKDFEVSVIPSIKQELEKLDDSQLAIINAADYKSPTTILIVSILVGGLGIDRFLLGEIGMGVLKLLTVGLFGILTIIDWFTCMGKARKKNYETFMQVVSVAKASGSHPADAQPHNPVEY